MRPVTEFMEAVVADLGTAVYERDESGALRLVGRAPDWMEQLRAADLRGPAPGEQPDPDELSPFLENFLIDAEEFWARRRPGSLDSGPWCEGGVSGGEWNLEATAVQLQDGTQALVVKRLQDTFAKYEELLQAARSASLEHERLRREVQKKEVLLHCIVHDLKGPLSGIVGGLSLLKRPTLAPDKAAEMIDMGLTLARKQESMIRLVLEVFSNEIQSMEAFETDAAKAPDAVECAEHARRSLEPAYQTKGVTLRYEGPEAPTRIVGQADRLERVLTNLLENALRYSPAGSTVTIAVRPEEEVVRVSVSDQGRGVSPELRDTLFDKFARDKSRGGVSGLGLYFCRYNRRGVGRNDWLRARRGRRFGVLVPPASCSLVPRGGSSAAMSCRLTAPGCVAPPPSITTNTRRQPAFPGTFIQHDIAAELPPRGH